MPSSRSFVKSNKNMADSIDHYPGYVPHSLGHCGDDTTTFALQSCDCLRLWNAGQTDSTITIFIGFRELHNYYPNMPMVFFLLLLLTEFNNMLVCRLNVYIALPRSCEAINWCCCYCMYSQWVSWKSTSVPRELLCTNSTKSHFFFAADTHRL